MCAVCVCCATMGLLETVLLLILGTLLPFITVLIVKGCHKELLFSLILCILGYVPGIVYAWYIVLTR